MRHSRESAREHEPRGLVTREVVQRAEWITFQVHGMHDARQQRLGLEHSRMFKGVTRVNGEELHWAAVDHPFVGQHLVELLRTLTRNPNRYPINGAGLQDLKLPDIAASKHWYSFFIGQDEFRQYWLHRAHERSRMVGEEYRRFNRESQQTWVRTWENETFDGAFNPLWNIQLVDIEKLPEIPLPRAKLEERLRNDEKFEKAFAVFMQRYLEGESADPTAIDVKKYWDNYNDRSTEERERIIEAFYKGLTQEEREEAAIRVLVWDTSNVLIDPAKRVVREYGDVRYKNDDRTGYSFLDDKTVVIRSSQDIDEPAAVGVVLQRREGSGIEQFNWEVVGYQFSDAYIQAAMYPLIAYRVKTDAEGRKTREYITQEEAQVLLEDEEFRREVPFADQLDITLGRMMLTYFSPAEYVKAAIAMPLRRIRRLWKYLLEKFVPVQEMNEPQMPVLFSLSRRNSPRDYADRVLRDANPAIQAFEKPVAA